MRKHIISGIAAGFFLATALAGTAAATAPSGYDEPDCPDGAVCFWTGEDFNGDMTIRENPGMGCDAAPHGRIGSMINNLDRPVALFAGHHCDGPRMMVGPWDGRAWIDGPGYGAHSWI
jgi:hypothetical protein